jgi:hypothetical protein
MLRGVETFGTWHYALTDFFYLSPSPELGGEIKKFGGAFFFGLKRP